MRNKKILLILAAVCSTAAAQDCSELSAARKSALADYVRKEYKLKETNLTIVQDKIVNSSCYRELTFQGKSSIKTWETTMYLAPDQRFLTAELFDTSLDPVEQQRQKAAALMAGLAENKGASKGPEHGPVTIVEFSDFQCPFCRRFADLMQQVLPEEKDMVRLVYHHMPLSMHPWARTAAEGAACAQLQSADAFWAMHDQIFQHQQEITPENVKQKLTEFARTAKSLDVNLFQSCLDNEMSLGLVFRDMNLASANQITGTPTIFINGRRIEGVKDPAQLRQLIEDAKAENIEHQSSNSQNGAGVDDGR
jgi:protein-disulfide isomerase